MASESANEKHIDILLDELVLTEEAAATKGFEEGYSQGEKKARRSALNVGISVGKSATRNQCFEIFLKHRLTTLEANDTINKANGVPTAESENQLRLDLAQYLRRLNGLEDDSDKDSLVTRVLSAYFKIYDPVHPKACSAYQTLAEPEAKRSPYQF